MSRLIFVARGVLSDYLLWAVSVFSGLFMTPVMLHYLKPEGYGLWAVFGSLLGYLGIVDLGLSPSTAKHVAQFRAQGRSHAMSEWVSSTLFFYVPLSAVVLGCAILMAPYVSGLLHVSSGLMTIAKWALIAASFSLAVALPRGALRGVIVGHQRMDIANLVDAAFVMINALTLFVVLSSGGGLLGAALASAGVSVLQTIVVFVLTRILYPSVRMTPRFFNPGVVRRALRFSVPILVVAITTQVVFRTDNIVIGVFRGAREVVNYAIAYTLMWYCMNLVFKISDSLLPVFSDLDAGGERRSMRRAYLESCRLSVALAFCLTVGLIFFGRSAITFWVGEERFVGMATLIALALLPAVHSVIHVGSVMLIGLGRARSIALLSVPDAGLNIVLSVVLVRWLGVVGVALGTLIPELLTTFWYIPRLCNREVRIPGREFIAEVYLRPLIAAAVGVVVAWGVTRMLFSAHPLATVCIGGTLTAGSYFAAYFASGTSDERAMYWRVLQRAWVKSGTTIPEG